MPGANRAFKPLPAGRFPSTNWTVICACAREERIDPNARGEFCRNYWYPVYAHLQNLGQSAHDAEDLTQEFFRRLLERPWFGAADRSRGRFRTFLLTSLTNFIRDRYDRQIAAKRGGKAEHFSSDLPASGSVAFFVAEESAQNTVTSFDMEWATTLVRSALRKLEAEYEATRKTDLFLAWRRYLSQEGNGAAYDLSARDLGISAGHVKIGVHRLRKRYGAILRDEIANTVTPEDVDDELRHLRHCLTVGSGRDDGSLVGLRPR